MEWDADRIKVIFAQALEKKLTAERESFLGEVCKDKPELRREVESLLRAHEQSGDFLEQTAPMPDFVMESIGAAIGRYRLLERIGEGGFGVVYMAEQQEPVTRKVALKVIKAGMDTREVIARFEAERQALALMDHPNIAKVLDGGSTEAGRPYFVMELVRGIPITEYCDQNNLSTNERLQLFIKVCQAVQHAHQKAVIHRDLKPSNILVALHDGEAVPKVIDFGVAKALGQKLTEKTLFTAFRQMIGTPAYMSPEQAGLSGLDVDTRSDIYSLGVLLYELLTGVTPFDKQTLAKAALDEIRRMIRESEPPKPSTRLLTLGDKLIEVAKHRHTEPATLSRLVRGDLDWIVMKCLEKDRARRYETTNGLVQDVERHLRAEPVSAAAPSFPYRAGKFLRRNRARLAFAGLVLTVIVLAVGGGKFALSYQSARKAIRTTGTIAVFSAAKSGDVEILRRLLDATPRLVDQRDADGSTPLAYASEAGKTNTMRLLLARGAAVDATNLLGRTPLLEAAANGRAGAVAALLEAGADPNHPANQGGTALLLASFTGEVAVGRLLLAKGARVEAVLQPWRTTALHEAAMLGHADFVELLLARGASSAVQSANGFTPLHVAASGMNTADALGIWNRRLQDLTLNVPESQSLGPAGGEISNWLARLKAELPAGVLPRGGEHRRVADLLLSRRADLEATNDSGWTPLHLAAIWTNRPVAEVLVAHRANLDARDQRGLTPLAIAIQKASETLAALLLEAGADPNLADNPPEAGESRYWRSPAPGHPSPRPCEAG
jgi:serine/threonine protein kinase/ankyrin repeat protein